jgi:hypothetical protein
MAKRKRSKNRVRSQTVVSTKSLEQQEIDARRWFDNGQYKEAIAAYKCLLQADRREEWQQQLAEAYRYRAQAIAAKNMYQEAALLWKNYAELSQQLQGVEQYIQWLLLARKPAAIAAFLKQQRERLPVALVQRVQALLGALLLANEKIPASELIDELGSRHYPPARAALDAYCAGDRAALAEQLGHIGFRSPYRDFKTLLNALQAFATDEPGKAQQLLDKIPADSVYESMAQLCRQQRLDNPRALRDYLPLQADQQSLVRCFAGLDKAQRNVLNAAQKALSANSSKLILETVIKHQALFGHEQSRAFCLALLPEYPAGVSLIRRSFELDTAEIHRLDALAHEREDPEYASDCWEDCIDSLMAQRVSQLGLKTALIRRHVAGLLKDVDPEEAIAQLLDSLNYDPDDKETYLRLYPLQTDIGDERGASQTLARALQQLPRDIDVLALNMRDSMRRKAFKKASGYAQAILDIDPINSTAQEGLLGCYRAHARKQIKAGKYALASKELACAVNVEQERASNGKLQILQGLLALKERDGERCGRLLQEGVQLAAGILHGHFLVCIETLVVGLRIGVVAKHYKAPALGYLADTGEIFALLADLERYFENYPQYFASAFAKIKKPLKQSLDEQLAAMPGDEKLRLCHYFERLQNYELLRFICKFNLQDESQPSLFVYYRLLGKTNGGSKRLEYRDRMALERAAHEAHQRRETGTLQKITQLLDRCESLDMPPEHLGGIFDLPVANRDLDAELDLQALLERVLGNSGDPEAGDGEAMLRLLFDGRLPTEQDLLELERAGPEALMSRLLEKVFSQMGPGDEGQQELF